MVIRPHWPAWLTGRGKIGQLIIEGPVLWGHHTILPSPWDSVQKSTVLSHPVLRHGFSNHCIPVHCTLYTPGHITSVGRSHRQLLLSSHPQRPLRSGSGVSQFLLIWERKGTYQKETPAQKSILPHWESLSCSVSQDPTVSFVALRARACTCSSLCHPQDGSSLGAEPGTGPTSCLPILVESTNKLQCPLVCKTYILGESVLGLDKLWNIKRKKKCFYVRNC